MTVQWNDTLRNALLDTIETTIGASPKVQIRTGAQPANAAAADSGTLLAEFPLGADWMANASGGSKGFSGLPLTVQAAAAGVAGHYRIKNNAGSVCFEQGNITATGGGGDMTLDNTNIAANQNVQITAWTKTAPGA